VVLSISAGCPFIILLKNEEISRAFDVKVIIV
jgi:hypothetical protein